MPARLVSRSYLSVVTIAAFTLLPCCFTSKYESSNPYHQPVFEKKLYSFIIQQERSINSRTNFNYNLRCGGLWCTKQPITL